MTGFNRAMTDVQRRAKARCIRALVQMEPTTPIEQAAQKHGVSRTHAYRMVLELETWEKTATYQDEASEILAQTKRTTYDPFLWLLASGKMTMAYAQGHDGVGPELFGGDPNADQILNADPLCD